MVRRFHSALGQLNLWFTLPEVVSKPRVPLGIPQTFQQHLELHTKVRWRRGCQGHSGRSSPSEYTLNKILREACLHGWNSPHCCRHKFNRRWVRFKEYLSQSTKYGLSVSEGSYNNRRHSSEQWSVEFADLHVVYKISFLFLVVCIYVYTLACMYIYIHKIFSTCHRS